jgi:hypothetical protein
LQTAAQSFFNENEISEGSLCTQIFQEMLRQAKVAKKSGARCVRYSNIMTRFAIALRIKMGVDKYDFLRKCFFLPSARTLSDYSSPGTSDPDGVLYSVVKSQQEKLEGHHRMKGKELGQKDFARHGSLAFDSIAIQGGLWFDPHSMKVVGYDEECFNLQSIVDDLHNLNKEGITGDDRCGEPDHSGEPYEVKNNDENTEAEARAKHYLVCFFSGWDGRAAPVQLCCARYAKRSWSSSFIQKTIRKIITALALHGFVVDTIAADGAAENRSAYKMMATITAREVFGNNLGENADDDLPMDMKIAFLHPIYAEIKVFPSADMPHLIKKVMNAFESSGKWETTKSAFSGQKTRLEDAEESMGGVGRC